MPKTNNKNDHLNIYIQKFRNCLSQTQGLSEATIYRYANNTKKFLKITYGNKHFNINNLSTSDIYNFITKFHNKIHPVVIQNILTSIRSFIKFLQLKGLCKSILIETFPKVPYRKRSKVPEYLSEEKLKKLLNSFDNDKTPFGLRNRAIVLCLVKLGLRACEVTSLCLEDIDWKSGVINIAKNKSRRTDSLPLLQEVGNAVVAYLKEGRPVTKDRHIFVNHGNNQGVPISREVVQYIVKAGYRKAGLLIPPRPTHLLRHTLATQLIQKGVTIKEIADLLRHRCLDTTMIYIKTNLSGLKEVVMPWPEVMS